MTGPDEPVGPTGPAGSTEATEATDAGRTDTGAGRRRPDPGDGLAALTGSGSSIVGVEGALRARDVSRPTVADLAAAATLPVRRATARPGEE